MAGGVLYSELLFGAYFVGYLLGYEIGVVDLVNKVCEQGLCIGRK